MPLDLQPMNHLRERLALLALMGALATCGCTRAGKTVAASSATTVPPSREDNSTLSAVSFLEDRVKSDPDDIVALNKLSGYYLQLHRSTEAVKYLQLALDTAKNSLAVLPADQNLGGLQALATAEFETHNFSAARDHARELVQYARTKSYGHQLLGDALLEFGDYEGAAASYHELEKLEPETVATESRLARLAFLKGDIVTAQRRYQFALNQGNKSLMPSAETIAWCNWQLGEVSFAIGEYENAERYYRRALEILPSYSQAAGSLARTLAARGALAEATALYEQMLKSREDGPDAVALGDLYKVSGRAEDATRMYANAERVMRLDPLTNRLFTRHFVLFLADHDLKPDEAYRLAKQEYEQRSDIYTADAFAWAALKANRTQEASAASKESLRLGNKDAQLFYHAGMIALAAGERDLATQYLEKALALNPQFSPLQSSFARKALAQLKSPPAKTL